MPRRVKTEQLFAAVKACMDSRGRIIPERVVSKARDPKSPLHHQFDWNDARCANTKRLEVAAELIRRFKYTVVYNDIKLACPVYIHDPDSNESAYVETVVVAKDNAKARHTLEDELARIKGALHRAMVLADVFQLSTTFQQMLDIAMDAERVLHRGRSDAEAKGKRRRLKAA